MIALSANSRMVLEAIATAHPTQRESLSLQTLADALGLSHRTVKRHVKRLRVLGYVEATRQNTGVEYSFDLRPITYKALKRGHRIS